MGNPMGQTRLDAIRTLRAPEIERAKKNGLSEQEIEQRIRSEAETDTPASFGGVGKPNTDIPPPPVAPDMADELLMKGAAGDVLRLRRGSRRNSFLGGAGDVRAPIGNTTLLGRGY